MNDTIGSKKESTIAFEEEKKDADASKGDSYKLGQLQEVIQ